MGRVYGYIGTYASDTSRGVYRFMFDTDSGRMTEPELFIEAPDAKWVSLRRYEQGYCLAYPVGREGRAGTGTAQIQGDSLHSTAEVLEETGTPCYILQEGEEIYTANYHEGTVMAYRMTGGRLTVQKKIEAGQGAGCHQILLHDSLLMVPCLTQHCIRLYDRKKEYSPGGRIVFPEGSGPRHGVFNKEHTRLYVVSEWSNELFVFSVRGREFELLTALPVLQEEKDKQRHNFMADSTGEKSPASAAVRLSAEERFLYVSVRGANLIAVFEICGDQVYPVQSASSGGDHPRDFILTEDGRFLLAANRYRGGIVSISRDRGSGRLLEVIDRIKMPQAVSVCLEIDTEEKL